MLSYVALNNIITRNITRYSYHIVTQNQTCNYITTTKY